MPAPVTATDRRRVWHVDTTEIPCVREGAPSKIALIVILDPQSFSIFARFYHALDDAAVSDALMRAIKLWRVRPGRLITDRAPIWMSTALQLAMTAEGIHLSLSKNFEQRTSAHVLALEHALRRVVRLSERPLSGGASTADVDELNVALGESATLTYHRQTVGN